MPIITSFSLSRILICFLKWKRKKQLYRGCWRHHDPQPGHQGWPEPGRQDPQRGRPWKDPESWPGSAPNYYVTSANPPKLSRGIGSHMGMESGIWMMPGKKFTRRSQIPDPLKPLPINGPRNSNWTESRAWESRPGGRGSAAQREAHQLAGRGGQDGDKPQEQCCLLKADGERTLKSQGK